MAETLAVQGPLTVGFNMPDDFHLYTSGVYFSTDCSKVWRPALTSLTCSAFGGRGCTRAQSPPRAST